MAKKEIDAVSGVETTGHEWDGLKELNNPLPRWWLWTLYATIVLALLYTIAYPASPLISSATPRLLGFSTPAHAAGEIAKFDAMNAPVYPRLSNPDLTAFSAVLSPLSLARHAPALGL